MKIMIVVTHLLGTGHLARAATLGRAFVAHGHGVTLVSGGGPVPRIDMTGITLVQMPPLRSDGIDFSRLLDSKGNLASDHLFDERRAMLCSTVTQTHPDALITELFPFGRRNLQAEFTALLDAAHALTPPPMIFASIRDILAPPSKPVKATLTEQIVAQYYDGVLVHSDPTVTPLDASWPVTPGLRARLIYTGFVAPSAPVPHLKRAGQGEIIVSAGGGDVGAPLFKAALAAARHDPMRFWRILVGGQNASAICDALRKTAPSNARIEPARPDFRSMLFHAKASVSMCGYNTALDVLQAGTPAVWVPFDAGGEVEQSLRADALANLPGMAVVRTADLSAERLLTALDLVTGCERRAAATAGLNGAENTVQVLTQRVGARS